MTRLWLMFDHPVKSGADKKVGFHGAHLAEPAGVQIAKPACGAVATHIARSAEPAGFILACCACLALSEVPSNG